MRWKQSHSRDSILYVFGDSPDCFEVSESLNTIHYEFDDSDSDYDDPAAPQPPSQ
jgi:hypothetical protein